jgi:hypothetical protein
MPARQHPTCQSQQGEARAPSPQRSLSAAPLPRRRGPPWPAAKLTPGCLTRHSLPACACDLSPPVCVPSSSSALAAACSAAEAGWKRAAWAPQSVWCTTSTVSQCSTSWHTMRDLPHRRGTRKRLRPGGAGALLRSAPASPQGHESVAAAAHAGEGRPDAADAGHKFILAVHSELIPPQSLHTHAHHHPAHT